MISISLSVVLHEKKKTSLLVVCPGLCTNSSALMKYFVYGHAIGRYFECFFL